MQFQARLSATPGLTRAAIAREIGVSRARITQIMNLLKLSPEQQAEILSQPETADRLTTEYRLRPPLLVARNQSDILR